MFIFKLTSLCDTSMLGNKAVVQMHGIIFSKDHVLQVSYLATYSLYPARRAEYIIICAFKVSVDWY